LHRPGVLKCWETGTGKQVYSERLEGLSTTWASPIADANGRLYFANAGRSSVLQTGPEFRVLAINELACELTAYRHDQDIPEMTGKPFEVLVGAVQTDSAHHTSHHFGKDCLEHEEHAGLYISVHSVYCPPTL
jgi:hypothetical protein